VSAARCGINSRTRSRCVTSIVKRLALIFGRAAQDNERGQEELAHTLPIAQLTEAEIKCRSSHGCGEAQSSASDWIDTCYVDDPELHPLLTLPAIDRQRPGNMHPLSAALQQRVSEFLAGRPECNRIKERSFA
jgi:hypothetical protein